MNRYVVGFMFDDQLQQVCMIRKNRPIWQDGKLNGIGGRIMDLECPIHAMVREFEEETGVKTLAATWAHVVTLRFPYAEIEVFAAQNTLALDQARTTTDEQVMKVLSYPAAINSPGYGFVENVPPLVALSMQRLTDREGMAPSPLPGSGANI